MMTDTKPKIYVTLDQIQDRLDELACEMLNTPKWRRNTPAPPTAPVNASALLAQRDQLRSVVLTSLVNPVAQFCTARPRFLTAEGLGRCHCRRRRGDYGIVPVARGRPGRGAEAIGSRTRSVGQTRFAAGSPGHPTEPGPPAIMRGTKRT